jgi:hypothetical protein
MAHARNNLPIIGHIMVEASALRIMAPTVPSPARPSTSTSNDPLLNSSRSCSFILNHLLLWPSPSLVINVLIIVLIIPIFVLSAFVAIVLSIAIFWRRRRRRRSLFRIVHARGAIRNEVGPARCRATPTSTNRPMRSAPRPHGACRRVGSDVDWIAVWTNCGHRVRE